MFRFLGLVFISLFATWWRRLRRGPLRPTWSFSVELFIDAFRRDWNGMKGWPAPRVRAHLHALPQPRGMVRKVRRAPVSLGQISGASFAVAAAPADRVILYLHGGSYITGSTRTHADIMARLAVHTGFEVIGVDYRLAPEHPYPAALDDAEAAYRALMERGVAADKIALCGDSAGGNLCLALCLRARDTGLAAPGLGVLFSPWLDLAGTRRSMTRNQDYDYGTRDMLRAQAGLFAGELELADARISLIHAELHGLPPLLLQYGGAELLEDECRDFADKARAAGVDITEEVLADMPHAIQLFAAYVPQGASAVERAAAYLRERLARDD